LAANSRLCGLFAVLLDWANLSAIENRAADELRNADCEALVLVLPHLGYSVGVSMVRALPEWVVTLGQKVAFTIPLIGSALVFQKACSTFAAEWVKETHSRVLEMAALAPHGPGSPPALAASHSLCGNPRRSAHGANVAKWGLKNLKSAR